MTTPTRKIISQTTLGSSASEVIFSGIDQSFNHLVLTVTGSTSVATEIRAETNGVTAKSTDGTNISDRANYHYDGIFSNNTNLVTANSARDNTRLFIASGNTDRFFSQSEFIEYSRAITFFGRRILTQCTGASADHVATLAQWYRTELPLTSIRIYVTSGTFNAGTTFTLRGVL